MPNCNFWCSVKLIIKLFSIKLLLNKIQWFRIWINYVLFNWISAANIFYLGSDLEGKVGFCEIWRIVDLASMENYLLLTNLTKTRNFDSIITMKHTTSLKCSQKNSTFDDSNRWSTYVSFDNSHNILSPRYLFVLREFHKIANVTTYNNLLASIFVSLKTILSIRSLVTMLSFQKQ